MTGRMQHHTIDYVEIPVTDVAEAKRFYGTAFGWTFTDYGPEYAGIANPAGDGPEVGGLARVEHAPEGPDVPTRPAPLVLLFSADLEGSVRAVEVAGGGVVDGPYDFPGGRRFHFTDPSGNHLAVWSTPAG